MLKKFSSHPTRKEAIKEGFTLVELLIVLTILAILGVATVLILNPAEILKKSRDTQRISDLNAVKSAIALYASTVSTPYLGGAASDATCVGGSGTDTLYVSLPTDVADPDGGAITDASYPGTFGDWGQTTEVNAGLTTGSGWIPVNLDATTGGAAISAFPADPNHECDASCLASVTNAALMYRYACNYNAAASKPTTFEIDAALESSYYTTEPNDIRKQDGGNNPLLLEVGTNLTLLPATDTF